MSRGYGAMLFKQSPRVQKTIRLMVTPVPTEMNVTFITYPVLQAMQYDYYLYQLYQFQSLQYDYYFSFISFNRHLPHYLPLAKTLSKSADTSIRSPPALQQPNRTGNAHRPVSLRGVALLADSDPPPTLLGRGLRVAWLCPSFPQVCGGS
jgi:hypothetical protein